MRPFVRSLLLAGLAAGTVLASVETASAWSCTARSRTAMGWGVSGYRAQAANIALTQCAYRTPRGLMCRITRCRR